MLLYDIDVIIYPGHFSSYLERFADFILDPFDNHFFKTKVELAGGSWKRGYRIEEFDGKYWVFKKDVLNTGSGSVFIDPPALVASFPETGEAITGQVRCRCNIEEYELLFRDLNSGKIYREKDFVGFQSSSDLDYLIKPINSRSYQFMVKLQGSWKAYILASRIEDSTISSIWIHLPEPFFREVRTWPE